MLSLSTILPLLFPTILPPSFFSPFPFFYLPSVTPSLPHFFPNHLHSLPSPLFPPLLFFSLFDPSPLCCIPLFSSTFLAYPLPFPRPLLESSPLHFLLPFFASWTNYLPSVSFSHLLLSSLVIIPSISFSLPSPVPLFFSLAALERLRGQNSISFN